MYKALISFTGAVSMKKGEVKSIAYEAIANDLIKCGYVESLVKKEDKPASTKKTSAKSKKKVEVIEDGE